MDVLRHISDCIVSVCAPSVSVCGRRPESPAVDLYDLAGLILEREVFVALVYIFFDLLLQLLLVHLIRVVRVRLVGKLRSVNIGNSLQQRQLQKYRRQLPKDARWPLIVRL